MNASGGVACRCRTKNLHDDSMANGDAFGVDGVRVGVRGAMYVATEDQEMPPGIRRRRF
jgi:hypothetical protein